MFPLFSAGLFVHRTVTRSAKTLFQVVIESKLFNRLECSLFKVETQFMNDEELFYNTSVREEMLSRYLEKRRA